MESVTSFTICLDDGTWSTENFDATLCHLNPTTSERFSEDQEISTVSMSTEINNETIDVNASLPVMNISLKNISSTIRPIIAAAGDRQARHIQLSCDQFPTIEHAQILKDETTKSFSNNKTIYQGSVIFQCQYGFFSEIYQDQPVRMTCHQGEFFPTLQCLGNF